VAVGQHVTLPVRASPFHFLCKRVDSPTGRQVHILVQKWNSPQGGQVHTDAVEDIK